MSILSALYTIYFYSCIEYCKQNTYSLLYLFSIKFDLIWGNMQSQKYTKTETYKNIKDVETVAFRYKYAQKHVDTKLRTQTQTWRHTNMQTQTYKHEDTGTAIHTDTATWSLHFRRETLCLGTISCFSASIYHVRRKVLMPSVL